ncbi:MAG: Ig-like domain-containing protein [Treponema sp.]|nr:Ig-like domain-containing protein [Treponema sp.]
MKNISFLYLLAGVALCVIITGCVYPANPVYVSSILIEEELWLNKGSSVTLTAEIYPPNATNKNVWWFNDDDNEDIVDVDAESGLVTALNTGEAVITVFARDGSRVTGSIKIIVPDFITEIPDSLVFNNDNYPVFIGSNLSLINNLFITPSVNLKNFIWSSSNTDVANVNQSGLVTGISAGDAVITVSSFLDPEVSADVLITVREVNEAVIMTPQEIFESLKGQKVITYGWADMANDGAGMSYANPANLTLIEGPSTLAKRQAFTNAINSDAHKFIIVSGDIDLSDGKIWDVPGGLPGAGKEYFNQFQTTAPFRRVNGDISFNIGSNTTIIGINNARLMFGGLVIRNGKNNIIIRNITFWDAHGSTDNDTNRPGYEDSKASATALQIENNPGGHSIWVDHCKFTDGTCSDLSRNYNHDGAFDIKHGRYITVSWTEFTNHDKVMLVGSSDGAAYLNPTDRQITLHHNYFHGVTQRMPRTRGTQMHIYNCYYKNIGNDDNGGSYMGPGVNAQFIVENNYFEPKVKSGSKTIEWMDSIANRAIVYYNGNNIANNNTSWWGRVSPSVKPWIPGYIYSLKNNSELPTLIPERAGPTLVFVK